MSWLTLDILSMAVVGALWGCTNPFIRKGSMEASTTSSAGSEGGTNSSFLIASLKSFLNVKVWLPYALNQSGSLVFYVLLANSNLSMAVPVCNAMALVFSFGTSFLLGEPIEKPLQTALGASLVLAGVTICVASQEEKS
jgi:Putative transmembrane family 234